METEKKLVAEQEIEKSKSGAPMSEKGKKISRKVKKSAKERETALRQVFYDNELQDFGFSNFTAAELKLLWNALYLCADNGTSEVVISYDEISKLAGLKNHNRTQREKLIVKASKKLLQTALYTTNEKGGTTGVNLFNRFDTDPENGTLTLQIAEESIHYVNNVIENTLRPELTGVKHSFSSLDLDFYSSLNQKYIMETVRHLESYQYTGLWKISVDKYRFVIGIDREPGNYDQGFENKEIKRKIINPLLKMNEETKRFSNLEYTPILKGRKLEYLQFTFDPIKKGQKLGQQPVSNEIQTEAYKDSNVIDITEDVVEVSTESDTTSDLPVKLCPKCGKRMILQNRKDDGKIFWAHRDWKTGGCNNTEDFIETEIRSEKKQNITSAVKRYYDEQLKKSEEERELRVKGIFEKYSDVAEIVENLRKARVDYTKSIFSSSEEEREKLRGDVIQLEMEQLQVMSRYGISPADLEIRYHCSYCKDTGILDNGERCSCWEQVEEIVRKQMDV